MSKVGEEYWAMPISITDSLSSYVWVLQVYIHTFYLCTYTGRITSVERHRRYPGRRYPGTSNGSLQWSFHAIGLSPVVEPGRERRIR